jgi:spore maturation protein CgeB
LVLAIRGSKILPETLDAMAGAVRVLWLQDIARRCELTPDQLKRYELRFVFEASDVRWLQDTYGLESEFLPVGFDPAVYHPDGNTSRDIDVFFIGAYYPERRATLERLAHDFRHLHLRFYGRHVRYREPKTWVSAVSYSVSYPGTFVNRCLNASEINHFYKRSKICLNMHHEQSQSGCNPRVFEIMGAGAFQLVDAIPYLRDNLGGVVTTYSCYDELRTTIEYYLREAKLREELATNGFKFVLEKHTFQHRVDRILEEVCRQ